MTASAFKEGQAVASGAALFTDLAAKTAKVNRAASDGATFSILIGRGWEVAASDSATFTDLGVGKGVKNKTASDSATFFESIVVNGKLKTASDSATFTDAAAGRNRRFFFPTASDSITFSDATGVHDTHVFAVAPSSPELMTFTDLAEAIRLALATASDTFTFTSIAIGHRAVSKAGSSSFTFTDLAKSNQFYRKSASSSATFTDLASEVRLLLGAHDTMTFTDNAVDNVLLSSGLVIPGGDQSSGLRQVLYGPISGKLPFSYAESSEGLVMIANGADPMLAWDGVSDAAWQAGVGAPDTVVTMTSSRPGLLTGVRYAFTRWLDSRGNVGNLSPVSDPINLGWDGFVENVKYEAGLVTIWSRNHRLASSAQIVIQGVDADVPNGVPIVNGTWTIDVVDANSFTLRGLFLAAGTYKTGGTWTYGSLLMFYNNVPIPTDPKIVRRQLLRNLEGNANVFYVDIDTTDLLSSSFSSGRSDEDLATSDAVPIQFDDREPNSQRYYPPPSHKLAVAAYAGRIWATADLVYSTGNVQVTFGSQIVSGIGTQWTAAMAGRLLYVDGALPQPISQVVTTSQMLVLETPYKGPSQTISFYSIRPAPIERRLVYFSEPSLPEAWPPWNAFALPESSDEIVGLFVLRSFLFVAKERNIYKFSYRQDPGTDGYVWPVAARGCINNRCYAQVESTYYLLDEQGIYMFDGDTATPLDGAQYLFKPDTTSAFRVDWTTDRTLWSCVHDPAHHAIRWFVDFVGKPPLTHAICYDYRREQWWLEQFQEAVSASALAVISGYRQPALGTTARRVYCHGQGTLDGISEAVPGTLSGTATAGDTLSLTDATANFPSNLAGVPVAIVSGTGAGQAGVISSNSATTIVPLDPWLIAPDATSTYQVGGVAWQWKSGWRQITDDEAENPRDLEFVFQPATGLVNAGVYHDHSSTPESWAESIQRDGVMISQGTPDITIDLSEPRGYAIHRMSGHRDPYGFGHRYTAMGLVGVQGIAAHRIYQVVVNGSA
jgi:hypothetical protein